MIYVIIAMGLTIASLSFFYMALARKQRQLEYELQCLKSVVALVSVGDPYILAVCKMHVLMLKDGHARAMQEEQ